MPVSQRTLLGSMTVAGMNIADFTPSVVNYTTDVAADVATVTVTATPVYEGAEAVVAPNTGDHQSTWRRAQTSSRSRSPAPNSTDTRTYTVTVNRAE